MEIKKIIKKKLISSMIKTSKRRKRKTGFAFTKWIPHAGHPAFYRKSGKDSLDYVTFTHSKEVDLEGRKVKTIPLTSNISKNERGKRLSYLYPRCYSGKRSALGKETKEFSLLPKDRDIVNRALSDFPKEMVKYTSNSKCGKKKK